MYAGILGGPRPRANALSSLARTGHVSPLARRPAAGAVQHAHGPAVAPRPGPQPMSARRAAATTALHSKTRRAVDQVVHYTREEVFQLNSDARLRRRMEAMPYARYNVHNVPAEKKTQVTDEFFNPVGKEAYAVGELWVYASTINDGFGTRRYWVYNTHTKVLVSFEPERGIAAKNRSYMSEKASFQNYAAGMGTLGHYGEIGVYGAAAGMLTFGAVYEAGGLAVVGTAVRGYLVKAAEGASVRMVSDIGQQFTVGLFTNDGGWGHRALVSFADINWLSVAGAGLVDTSSLKWYGKILASFNVAVATNAVSIKLTNIPKYGTPIHVVNPQDKQENKDFVVGVIASVAFDQVKEYGAPWLGRVFSQGPNTLGQLHALKYYRAAKAAAMPVEKELVDFLSYEIGTTLDTAKKFIETHLSTQQPALPKPAPNQRPASPKLPR